MAAGKVGLMADEMGGAGGTLDIGPLRGAVKALGDAIGVYNRSLPDADAVTRDTWRSGVIKNFEVAYELCW
ncbi:MAG: nucleotidyltransferase substrate binding protein, partial [Chitinispirillia bacterium]|nr:nucleotidyltransferase substrate binding protein [Chitinispirillia bacterium]MCL2268728.1 nucleotidyltransferase substrate binding protein [Chitinispirillia bacterium]